MFFGRDSKNGVAQKRSIKENSNKKAMQHPSEICCN